MIGKTLAHYDVTAQLGAGGMGEVYRAHDTRLDREVALKILPESFAADAERLSRFEREAKLLAALNHANIAAIYGIEQADSQRFLVLELVEGIDLAKRLAEGPLIVEDALAVAHQISEALEAAHEHGVIHRDLKPANVVVSPNGTVKVLDFGLAKAMEADKATSNLSHSPTVLASSPTMQGAILGTAAYMSPEQARGKVVDRRADIWAFGVVLYEMLTAKQLFSGETVSDMLASVIKTDPEWDSLPKDTPRAIIQLLERCLDKDPRTRLRDIGEARVIIDRVLRGEIKDEATVAGEAAPAPKGSRVGWIAGMVLVAAVAAATVWMLKPGKSESPLRKFKIAVESEDGTSPVNPAISADGSKIVYVLDGKLFVQELNEFDPREVPAERGAFRPCWSPDGEFICYISGGDIWKVPVRGGASVKICEPKAGFTSGTGIAWSPDDRIIYAQGNAEIFEVSANGGDPRILVPLLEDEADMHEPALLPDGKGLLFVSHRKNASADKIEVVSGGERKLLLHVDGIRLGHPTYSPSGHLVFTRSGTNGGVWAVPFSLASLEVTGEPFPVAAAAGDISVAGDGTLVYLRGATGNEVQFVWVERDGTISEPITEGSPGLWAPALSPDGKRLALCEWDGTQVDIWMHDLERGTRTRFTFGETNDLSPEWTPDGMHVMYSNARSDSLNIKKADGTGAPTPIVKGRNPSLSPDGKYVVYHVQGGATQGDLWYYELSGQSEPKALLTTQARERRGRVSRDGNYVAYESDESGNFEIYLTRFPTGEGKWQVSISNGYRPRWSTDGRSLYYQDTDGNLMEVSVALDPSPVLGTPVKVLDCVKLGLRNGFGREYEVAIDGSRFLWSKSMTQDTGKTIDVGITLVENWAREFAE